MIGRLYIWRGAVWLCLARGEPFDRGPRRNVLLERVAPWLGVGMGNQWFQAEDGSWWRPDSEGWPAYDANGRMIGERVVRPFRGLRRWRP